MRGGDKYWNFMSYNPPVSINNWANEYTEISEREREDDTLVIRTTYLDVPPEWLGQQFIEEAEYLQESNPRAYENEYMGIPVGTGGNVFDNIVHLDMSDEFISTFDTIYNGLDWGYANDPNAFIKVYFDKTRQDLYIFGEHVKTHESNRELFETLYKDTSHLRRKIRRYDENIHQEVIEYIPAPLMEFDELLTADSAEPKSIADLKSYGCFIRAAIKGPDSIRYGIKWLQSLHHIYIDKRRCPNAYDEFTKYEFDRDKSGNIISAYPDANNHLIDACRYSLERFYKRRGN